MTGLIVVVVIAFLVILAALKNHAKVETSVDVRPHVTPPQLIVRPPAIPTKPEASVAPVEEIQIKKTKRGRPCKCVERGIICKHGSRQQAHTAKPDISSQPYSDTGTSGLLILHVSRSNTLPSNEQSEHRFEIHSTSSNRIYEVSQNKEKRYWSCSCRGWKTTGRCKHLTTLSLPAYERPYEVEFQETGPTAELQVTQSYPPELCDSPDVDLSLTIPKRFVVFDLETTGLSTSYGDIVEIGAIRVNGGSDQQEVFQALVKPTEKIPEKSSKYNGITQEMLDRDGEPLETVMEEFAAFIGNLPLVSFNADFDMKFLLDSAKRTNIILNNRVSCALKMSRRAWPERDSYKLSDICKDANLSDERIAKILNSNEYGNMHRALGDSVRAAFVYHAAASILGMTKDVR